MLFIFHYHISWCNHLSFLTFFSKYYPLLKILWWILQLWHFHHHLHRFNQIFTQPHLHQLHLLTKNIFWKNRSKINICYFFLNISKKFISSHNSIIIFVNPSKFFLHDFHQFLLFYQFGTIIILAIVLV